MWHSNPTVTCSSKAGGQSAGASFAGRSDSVAESAVASSSWNAVLRAKPWLCRQLRHFVSCHAGEQRNSLKAWPEAQTPAVYCVHTLQRVCQGLNEGHQGVLS